MVQISVIAKSHSRVRPQYVTEPRRHIRCADRRMEKKERFPTSKILGTSLKSDRRRSNLVDYDPSDVLTRPTVIGNSYSTRYETRNSRGGIAQGMEQAHTELHNQFAMLEDAEKGCKLGITGTNDNRYLITDLRRLKVLQ